MKFKKSDIQLVGGLVVVLAAVAFYFGCTMKLSPQMETLKTENLALQSEVAYLQDLMNHKEEYIAETEMMQGEIDNIVSQFPADVKTETQIMYANNLELSNAIFVENVDMPGKEMVVIETPTAQAADGQPVDSAAAATDATAQTTEAQAVDSTATAAPSSALASTIMLYRSPTTIGFKSTYKSFKDVIKAINEDTSDKKAIESVDVAFDEETGNLTGTLVVQMYSMEGTDAEYIAPSVTGVKSGTTNVFKTTENANALRTTTTDKTGDATDTETEADDKENVAESTEDAE